MKSSIDVYLSLKGQRKFAKEVEASGAELEAMGLKGAKSMAAFAKSANKLKSFGKSWTHNVSLPIAGLSVVAGGMAVNFKRQMGLVATDAGGTAKEVAKLEKAVLGLARESQFGPQKLAESLFHVESSGYRGAKAMKVLNASQKLATTGNSELQSTTYALVSATKSLYGDSLKNVNRTAAELNGIVAHGDMRLEELTAAMATGVIPKAKSVGLNLRDVGAAMDVMTSRGIPAQRAAYALGFTMQKLIPATEKAEAAFASVGLGQETLLKASQHGKYGYVTGLEVLQKHLDRLPTKGQQTKVIEEMFGGGRMTSGLLTDLQNLGDMKKIYGELGHEVKVYAQHTKEAEEQPKVKLERAWSSIQASLIEIGDELVPVIVPAVEKVAKFGQKAAAVFQKMPGSVKAIGLGALFAIGPVSSMLGYFAGGVGRTLILTKKLVGLSKTVSGLSWGLGKGMGFSGASAYSGFGKLGSGGALQAARGFAEAIGPAIALAGIGNIVYSATQGNWKEAGAEGAGAFAGGLAAFLTGNPELAPLTAGLGSFAGKFLYGIFSSGPKISKLRAQTEHLSGAMQEYRKALHGIKPAEEALARSKHKHIGASQKEITADQRLHHALVIYGAGSRQANKAQLSLAEAQKKVTRTGKAEANAHRLAGNRLELYRQDSIKAVGALKQLLSTQRRRVAALNKENRQGKLSHEGLEELVKLEGRQTSEKHDLTKAYAHAETVAGKPWAHRLESLTALQAEYGRTGKGLVNRMGDIRTSMGDLHREGLTQQFREENRELKKMMRLYEQINELGTFAPAPATAPGRKTLPRHHGKSPHGHHPSNHNTSSPLRLPAQARLSLDAGSLGSGGVFHIHVQNDNVLQLDGKPIAENTTKESKRAALRE